MSTGNRVLDYGSGSGILGLAALKFGATEVRWTSCFVVTLNPGQTFWEIRLLVKHVEMSRRCP